MKCHKCGEEMEKGYLFIRSSKGWTSFLSAQKPGYHNFWDFPKVPEGSIKVMWRAGVLPPRKAAN